MAALVLAPTLAACTPSTPEAGFDVVTAAGVERDEPSQEAAGSAGSATTALGTDLFAALKGDGNLVLSPYSVAVALAMTRAGAAGVTAEEMDGVLHADELDDLHAAFGSLDAVLAERPGTFEIPGEDPVELEVSFGNAVWPQTDFPFEDPFLEALARNYGAGVNVVDYINETEAARDAINDWVADQTRDRIPELIPQGVLSTLTRLVLTNAVYLNAPWRYPFEEDLTADGPFTLLDGSTVDVPLMRLAENLAYGADEGWEAVRLPYVDGNLSMVVLVPDAGSYASVADGFDEELIGTVDAALSFRQVQLAMPSFEFRTQSNLNDALKALGMPTAFTEEADFSAMSSESLAITDVLHEAFISVDEEGTEAAAATAVIVGETSAPEPVAMTIDRPYLFWIVDEPTGAVLFLGQVLDPTAD